MMTWIMLIASASRIKLSCLPENVEEA